MAPIAKGPPSELTLAVVDRLNAAFGRTRRTQVELAKVAGMSQSHLAQVLLGNKHIDIDQLDRLCAALGEDIVEVVRVANGSTPQRSLPSPLPPRRLVSALTTDDLAALAAKATELDEPDTPSQRKATGS